VGIRQTSKRDQHGDRKRDLRVDPEGHQGHADDQEDDRQGREQDGQRDFVGRLLPLGALDQADHPVEKAVAWIGGDFDFDFIGKHPRSARDRTAVAARLANDRSRFARNGRFIDGGRAFDDFTVAGDHFTRRNHDDVAFAQNRASTSQRPFAKPSFATVCVRDCRKAFAWALPRPSAIASAKLAKRTVNQSQMEIWMVKAFGSLETKISAVVTAAPTMVTNMTGFLIITAGFSFLTESPRAGITMRDRRENGLLCS
jgi:hypothetical protein